MPLYLIAAGPNGNDLDWTRRFFNKWADGARAPIQGWAPHYYCGTTGHALEFTRDQWYEMLHKANAMEKLIARPVGRRGRVRPRAQDSSWSSTSGAPGIPRAPRSTSAHLFEQMGCLRDALVAASTLDTFNRHADKVDMANIAQLVNNLHSLFLADGDKFVATPNFHVFEMYRPHQGGRAVRMDIAGEHIGFEAQGRKGSHLPARGIGEREGEGPHGHPRPHARGGAAASSPSTSGPAAPRGCAGPCSRTPS